MPASDGSSRSPRQPNPRSGGLWAAFGGESGDKSGKGASISAGWPITTFIATHLQLHLETWFPETCREAGGLAVFEGRDCRRTDHPQETTHVRDRTHASPAPDLQSPGLVES